MQDFRLSRNHTRQSRVFIYTWWPAIRMHLRVLFGQSPRLQDHCAFAQLAVKAYEWEKDSNIQCDLFPSASSISTHTTHLVHQYFTSDMHPSASPHCPIPYNQQLSLNFRSNPFLPFTIPKDFVLSLALHITHRDTWENQGRSFSGPLVRWIRWRQGCDRVGRSRGWFEDWRREWTERL